MSKSLVPPNNFVVVACWGVILQCMYLCAQMAYKIRLHAIDEYGPIIHEFDPYFNYRATEYLYYNGWQRFVTWFDYKAWYPLGRPVGTTIYPGMQVTAVFLKNWIIGEKMSLNDVCCYMPAWFGVSASFFTGLLAYECSLPQNSSGNFFTFLVDIYRGEIRKAGSGSPIPAAITGVTAMGIMSMIPAHLMRSVAGGYDNESLAMTAMSLTFWLWCRSLRANEDKSYLFGIATGFAYFYMVAAWGGYVFVLNLIGCHAALLVLVGRFSTKVYRAYSLFYVVGTYLAIQVPVVGLTPLKSLEQLGPCAVFLGYQVLQYCEYIKRQKKLSRAQTWQLRIKVALIALLAAVIVVRLVVPSGYFGPISARVRGLFVKHTKTGNPLVDSVAEHQPANDGAYYKYGHNIYYVAPIGLALTLLRLGDGPFFLVVYACIAYFFSNKMVRLILLLGPIASVLGGIALGTVGAWCLSNVISFEYDYEAPVVVDVDVHVDVPGKNEPVVKSKKKESKKGKKANETTEPEPEPATSSTYAVVAKTYDTVASSTPALLAKLVISYFLVTNASKYGEEFTTYCWDMSYKLSHPTIIMKAETNMGTTVLVDDYREAYTWIKENTPEDSRILAWWDYGYQISAIANRTTIADGNTWNHEHIALLGKTLMSSEKEGHRIARHLADYILLWTGGGGDDLAKSPHIARIANSVYRDLCPEDPTCRSYLWADGNGNASPMMEESLLYKLHSHDKHTKADPNRFKEVFTSKYEKVRIFKVSSVSKESKAWVADPANRVCDAPGSWFCRGQYPPALNKVLQKKKDFAQLEDFNANKKDDEYQKAYFDNLNNKKKGDKKLQKTLAQEAAKKRAEASTASNQKVWANSDDTTLLWELINANDFDSLKSLLETRPELAFVRSSDGRGPMWWAFEYRREKMIKLLMKLGVSMSEKDKDGKSPLDLK